jgi:hypothetical protein
MASRNCDDDDDEILLFTDGNTINGFLLQNVVDGEWAAFRLPRVA